MLDVHILTLPNTRRDWQEQCIASANQAAARASYPVHIHVVQGIPGNLGASRKKGYAAGNSPWKCYIDDDDYVLPEAFELLGPHLEKGAAVIFPKERLLQNGRFHSVMYQGHHLWPIRSDLAASFDHEMWKAMPDEMLSRVGRDDPRGALWVDDVVYVHRIYLEQRCRQLRKDNEAEVTSILPDGLIAKVVP